LVWINPQPISEDIGKLYFQYFTHQNLDSPKRALAGLRKSVSASILQSSFGYQMIGSNKMLGSVLSRINPIRDIVGGSVRWLEASERGRLLDVGCGNGSFLVQMKQLGWEVTGIEPDGEAASFSRKNYGLDVFKGPLEEAKYPNEHFDTITMNHVIEHVLDPISLLKECRRILRPGGKLIVITPNIDSLGQRIFREAWLHWDPPRHLFLFSSETLGETARRAGLVNQELRTTMKGARSMWAASSLIRRDGVLPGGSLKGTSLWMKMQELGFLIREYGFCGPQEKGEEIVMMAWR